MLRLKKRYELIAALAVAQLVCLGGGLAVFAAWVHSSTREAVHEQVLQNNVTFAKTVTDLIDEMRLGDIRGDDQEWERAQSVVRGVQLPNNGYVCLYDNENDGLLCHPALTTRPRFDTQASGETMPGKMMGKWKKPMAGKGTEGGEWVNNWKSPMPGKAVASKAMPGEGAGKKGMPGKSMAGKWKAPMPAKAQGSQPGKITSGVIGEGDSLELIAAAQVPALGVRLMVHQRGPSIEKAITNITGPILPVGFTVVVALVTLMTATLILVVRSYDDRLRRMNQNLEDRVHRRTRSLRKTRDAVIFGLAKLAESRDTDTGEHLERIRTYTTVLAKQLRSDGVEIGDQVVHEIGLASSLHDIGKVGVADRVLLKPGRLDAEERVEIERHAGLGGDCLDAIGERLGEDDFLQLAKEIAYGHHEKWDGSGYPAGVAGEMIPLPARIVALADVYDALRSRRPYKEPMPHEKARSILLEGRGSHFDPVVVEAFLACEDEFVSVSEASNAAAHQDHACQGETVEAVVAAV